MAMTDDRELEAVLEPFFAAARQAAPVPSPAVMQAILSASERPVVTAEPARRVGLAAFLSGIGLWGALGGMATAAAVGVWLGFVGSEQVMRVATGYGETETTTLLADSDILALAGE